MTTIEITKVNKKKVYGEASIISCKVEELEDKINIIFPTEIKGFSEGDELEILIK